jgi:hypothetical protein
MWKGQWVPVFAGGADDPPTDPPADPAKNDPPASTFKPVQTQEEFDRMVADRIARERKKYGDYDDLKTKADEYDKLKASQQTEQEKLQARAEQAEKERDDLRNETTSLRATLAIEKAAAKANIVDPEMAAQLIDRKSLEFNDEGFPTKESLDKALEDVIDRHPILKGTRFQGGADGGNRGGAAGAGNMNDLIRQKAGRI